MKLRRAALAQHEGGRAALEESVRLCGEAEVLRALALATPAHVSARLHMLRARARRQLAEERFGTGGGGAWGGVLAAGEEDAAPAEGAEGAEGGAEGAGAGEAETAYEEVMGDLETALALLAEEGGADAQAARCLALEAALLHGAALVPGRRAAHLRAAVGNLAQAAALLQRRRALVAAAALDAGGAPAAEVPAFVSAELLEAAVEQSALVARQARAAAAAAAAALKGKQGRAAPPAAPPPEAPPPSTPDLSLRSLASLLLALLRERAQRLFDDGPCSARIAALHRAMADAFPPFDEACRVHLAAGALRAPDPAPAAAPHRVLGQWYRPRDAPGDAGGDAGARLLLAVAPAALAGEGGQGVMLCERALVARRGGFAELARLGESLARLTWEQAEEAAGADAAPARGEWAAQVFPAVGSMELQGEAAAAARARWFADAVRAANADAMRLLGVADADADATPEPAEEAEEADGARAAEVPAEGLGRLEELVGGALPGLDTEDEALAAILHAWLTRGAHPLAEAPPLGAADAA